jgi:TonB family protein
MPSLEALVDAAASDLSEQVKAHYDRKEMQQRRPQRQQQAMVSGGGMQVRGTGAGGRSDAFSKSVIDALMKTRPGPFALWGRVLVSFQITQQGDLLYVRVLQSSGNKAIDDAAVNAIHKARFTKPPEGLSPEARTYIIDYVFG